MYRATYAFVGAAPLMAATRRDLRWFITRGWRAMACVVPLWLYVFLVGLGRFVEEHFRGEPHLDAPFSRLV